MNERRIAIFALIVSFLVGGGVLLAFGGDLLHLIGSSTTSGGGEGRLDSSTPSPGETLTRSPTSDGILAIANALKFAGVTCALSILVVICVGTLLVKNRIDAREQRQYGMFPLYLSMHDAAHERDLEDMVEALAFAVREFPEQRARTGQPFFAIDMLHGPSSNGEMEWALMVWCELDLVETIESAFSNAYPDVRIGRTHGGEPKAVPYRVKRPGYVMRFRKARSFLYPLSTEDDKDSSPPMEAIAQNQITVEAPSIVRLQFLPAPLTVERWARRKFRRRESSLVRSEAWGAPSAGLRSVLNQEEMKDAKRTQNRAMFWLEVQVATDTRENANRIASALTARRGDNSLHRRWMLARVPMYCARFPRAYPPLLPTVGWGRFNSLVSSAEVAHLLRLPGARMKAVPVRRTTVPRLPAPPEIARASNIEPELPNQTAPDEIVVGAEIVSEVGAPRRRPRRAGPAAAPAQAPDAGGEVPEDSVFYEAEREDVDFDPPAQQSKAGADQITEADVAVDEPVVHDGLGTPEAADRLREPKVLAPKYAADDPDFYPDGRIKADIAPEMDRPPLDRSAVRSVAGYEPTDQDRRTGRWKDEIPETDVSEGQWHIKQLAMIDRINRVGDLEGVKDAEVEEPSRMREEMLAALRVLDRVPLVMRDTLGRAAFPNSAPRTVQKRLEILRKAGYVYRAKVDMPNRETNLPSVYALTETGMKVAQKATPPVIDPERKYRKTEARDTQFAHIHHALHWVMRLQELLGPEVVTDNWRTPQVGAGVIKVPMIGNGNKRRQVRYSDVVVPKGQHVSGVWAFADERGFREIAPDVSIELDLRNARRGEDGELRGLRFDLLVELDRTGRASYDEEKFVSYDALLTSWWALHPRYEKLMTRPIVVFVADSREHAESLAAIADRVMTGRIGYMGLPPHESYFPGREHIFFAVEADLYHGSLRAFALDPMPPQVRKALGHGEAPRHRVISLLPPAMIGAHERKANKEV